MPKATKASNTRRDASIHAMIIELRQLWRERFRCDELARALRGRNKDRMIAKLDARGDELSDLAIDLECRIALTKPRTRFEYQEIVNEINAAQFERSDLVELAWRLGRESVALGITAPPVLDKLDRPPQPRRLPSVRRKATTGKASAGTVEQPAAI